MNSLHRKDIERLWLPEVIYENTDMKDTTRLGDRWEWGTQVFVDRLGKPTPPGSQTGVLRGRLRIAQIRLPGKVKFSIPIAACQSMQTSIFILAHNHSLCQLMVL